MTDINVLDRSSIFGSILDLIFDTQVDTYAINEYQRDWLCFFADEIYPPWSIFAKTDPSPINEEEGNMRNGMNM